MEYLMTTEIHTVGIAALALDCLMATMLIKDNNQIQRTPKAVPLI
jgi:hypothetical protein